MDRVSCLIDPVRGVLCKVKEGMSERDRQREKDSVPLLVFLLIDMIVWSLWPQSKGISLRTTKYLPRFVLIPSHKTTKQSKLTLREMTVVWGGGHFAAGGAATVKCPPPSVRALLARQMKSILGEKYIIRRNTLLSWKFIMWPPGEFQVPGGYKGP